MSERESAPPKQAHAFGDIIEVGFDLFGDSLGAGIN